MHGAQSTSKRPDPEAVLAFISAGHTNDQAAAHFQVHPRTIRKWRARVGHCQKAPETANSPARIAQELPEMPIPVGNSSELLIHIPDQWIVRDGQLWRCPVCRELMPPLPGTTGAVWNERGCYLHQVEPASVQPNTSSDAKAILDVTPAPAPIPPFPPLFGAIPAPAPGPWYPLAARPAPARIIRMAPEAGPAWWARVPIGVWQVLAAVLVIWWAF